MDTSVCWRPTSTTCVHCHMLTFISRVSTRPSLCLSVSLSVSLSVCLSVSLSVCLSVCLLRHSCMCTCVLSLMSVVTMTVVVYVLVAFIGWIRCTYVWQYGTGRRRLSVVWLVVFEAADGSTIGSGSGCAPASSSSNYATLGRPLSLPVSRQQRHLSSSDPDLATSSTTSPDSDMTTYSGQFNTCVIQCHVICSLYYCCKWIIDW